MGKRVVNKKAQITIFVILAMIIVVVIALLFLLFNKPKTEINPEENPNSYIESCIKKSIEEASELILKQGGYIEPKNYKLYMDEKIGYLCYTNEFYKTCVNQEPVLLEHLKSELISYTKPKVEECYLSIKQKFEEKNYEVQMEGMKNYTIEIKPKQINAFVTREIKISRGKEIKELKEIKTGITSPLYELADVASEIVSQETRYCNFEYLGFMIIYPEYDIKRTSVSNSVKIYTVKELASNKEIKFAIRGCAIPSGI
ncbi:MAG: hypothetical protein ACP5OG_03520 [Candidatus Nanoarchaeia archaeon]